MKKTTQENLLYAFIGIALIVFLLAVFTDSKLNMASQDVTNLFSGSQSIFESQTILDTLRQNEGLTQIDIGCANGFVDWACGGSNKVVEYSTKYTASTDKCDRKIIKDFSCPSGTFCNPNTVNSNNLNHDGAPNSWQCTGTTKPSSTPPPVQEFTAPKDSSSTQFKIDLTQAQPLSGSEYYNPDGTMAPKGLQIFGESVQNTPTMITDAQGLKTVIQGGRVSAHERTDLSKLNDEGLVSSVCAVKACDDAGYVASEACPASTACVPFSKLISEGTLPTSAWTRTVAGFFHHIELLTAGGGCAASIAIGALAGTVAEPGGGTVVGVIGGAVKCIFTGATAGYVSSLIPADAALKKLADWGVISAYYAQDQNLAGLCVNELPSERCSRDNSPLDPNSPTTPIDLNKPQGVPVDSSQVASCDVSSLTGSVCPVGGNQCGSGFDCVAIKTLEDAQVTQPDCGKKITEYYQGFASRNGYKFGGCLAGVYAGSKIVGGIATNLAKGIQLIKSDTGKPVEASFTEKIVELTDPITKAVTRTTTKVPTVDPALLPGIEGEIAQLGKKKGVVGKVVTGVVIAGSIASWAKGAFTTAAVLAPVGVGCYAGLKATAWTHNVLTNKEDSYGLCIPHNQAIVVGGAAAANTASNGGGGLADIAKNALESVLNGLYDAGKSIIKSPTTTKVLVWAAIIIIGYFILLWLIKLARQGYRRLKN